MAKPFDYSKWDNIELSDDEEDVHPNIDRESWFRLKHRSRVEREEKEENDKKRIRTEMASAELRIKEIQKLLDEIDKSNDADDSDDEDLEDKDGLLAELEELKKSNQARQNKLDEYERNKKWNVDNICHVVEEKTIITKGAAEPEFSNESGYALPSKEEEEELLVKEAGKKDDDDDDDDEDDKLKVEDVSESRDKDASSSMSKDMSNVSISKDSTDKKPSSSTKPQSVGSSVSAAATSKQSSSKSKSAAAAPLIPSGSGPNVVSDTLAISMMTYPSFVQKYEDILETFMAIGPLDKSKEYLLLHGHVLLQENASSYLLLACLEDEMNGLHDKMRLVARQSQILTNIAELAKTLKQHPGNVIVPFFRRLDDREHLESFVEGVNIFIEKVKARAIVKKREIDEERAREQALEEGTPLSELAKEDRMGPGGLDPVEVFESLPQAMQDAFESRDTEKLKMALLALSPEEAKEHMDRCVASGLWNEG